MEAMNVEELKEILHHFKKDKIQAQNGWSVELFLDTYEFLGVILLRVVEEVRVIGRILNSFNMNFIALIPKIDDPASFDDFRPISLYNRIYKIISKIIARMLKSENRL